MPRNVNVQYCGSVVHRHVVETIAQHDILFLPTKGENHGHVILEALLAGTPVLVSNNTPWSDAISRGLGWVAPLEARECFRDIIENINKLDADFFMNMRRQCRQYAKEVIDSNEDVEAHFAMFSSILRREAESGA